MRMKKFLTFLLTLAMVVSMLPATAFAANNTATTMRLAKTQGTVAVTNATGKQVKQTGNMKLYNGYKIKTGAKSYAWISLDNTKAAKLDANSVVSVQKSGQKLTLYLSSGNLFFNVKDPLKSGESFHIKTSTMTTGIRGTSGCVRVINDRVTEVHLLTGQVEIYTENPALHISKTAVLKAGQKATSLIADEAMAAMGEQAGIIIEQLTHEEVCGNCSKEIAADPALVERIRQEAPHLLPEKIAAEADERLAADEKAAEEKQAAIDEKVAQQVFPEDVDPYFEQEESSGGGGGGGGSAAVDPSSIRNVATWRELLDAVNDYNAGEDVTRINLTADIDGSDESETLEPIGNQGPLTLNLGTNELRLNDTLENTGNLTITNIEGYLTIYSGTEQATVVRNSGVLTLEKGTIVLDEGYEDSIALVNSGTFNMTGGAIRIGTVTTENGISEFKPAESNDYTVYVYQVALSNSGIANISGGTIGGGISIENNGAGTLNMTGGTIEVTTEGATGISNYGTATLTDGDIYVRNGAADAVGVDSFGTLVMSGGIRVRAYNGIGVRANRNVKLDEGAAIWAYGTTAEAVVLGGDEEAILTRPVLADISAENFTSMQQQGVFNPLYEGMTLEPGPEDGNGMMYKLVDGAEALDYADIDTWEKFVRAINEFNTDTDDTEDVTIKLTASIPTDAELEEGGLDQPQMISNTSKKLIIDLNNSTLTLPYTLNNNSKLEITGQGAIYTDATTSTMIFNEGTGATLDVTGNVYFELSNGTAIANAAGTVNMKDGIMHLNNTQTMGIVSDNGAVNMTGGEIILVSGGTTYSNYGIMAANADVTINGGTITESIDVADPDYMKNYGVSAEGGTVKLTSGSITMNYGVAVNVSDVDDLTLGSATVLAKVGDNLLVAENSTETGYTFSAYNDTHFVLQSEIIDDGIKTWAQFVAAVDEFNGGNTSQTIRLAGPIDPDANEIGNIREIAINNANNVTLTIDTQTNTLNLPVTMVVNAPLTITGRGNGSNIMASPLLGNAALIRNNDELTLDGSLQVDNSGQIGVENYGTFTLNGVDGAAIYVNGGIGVSVADGTADLKYGTVNVSGAEAIGVQVGADGKLNMNGSAAIYATQPTSGNNYAVYDNGGIIDIESGTIQATGTTSYALFGINWNRLSVDTTNASVSASSAATVISPTHANYTTEARNNAFYLVNLDNGNNTPTPEPTDPEAPEGGGNDDDPTVDIGDDDPPLADDTIDFSREFVGAVLAFDGTSATATEITLEGDVKVDNTILSEYGVENELPITATGRSTLTIDLAGYDLTLDVPLANGGTNRTGGIVGIENSGNGGSISGSAATLISNTATLSLDGVAMEVTGGNGISNSGSLQINNNTSIQVDAGTGISTTENTLIMNGGSITVNNNAVGIQATGGTLNLRGGSITADGTTATAVSVADEVMVGTTIGTVLQAVSAGGVYDGLIPTGYTVAAEDTYYVLQLIAQTSDEVTAAFAEAVVKYNAGQLTESGNTITLEGNVSVAEYTHITGDSAAVTEQTLTIDLNGYDMILDSTLFNESNLTIVGPGRVLAGPGFRDSTYGAELIRNHGELTWNGATMHLHAGLVGITSHNTLNMTNCVVTAENDATTADTFGVVYFRDTIFSSSGETCVNNVTFSAERLAE